MQPIPRTRRTPQNVQHTYSLSRRIHDVKTYPVQSPQGATVIIYGHENGLTLVWRGGRRLRPAKQPSQDRRNGESFDDAVMVIDSDAEAPGTAAPAFVDNPEFEDNPTADSFSVPEIIQTLDLALGTAVLHVAVLPMPPCPAEDACLNGASIFKSKIVFAVTCATADAYVVTLPLTPPSHESKARPDLRKNLFAGNAGTGAWGETLTLLGGQGRPCNGLAITTVKQKPNSRSRSLERAAAQASPITRLIVAAHSREACGTLRLWDVALDAKPGAINRVEPFQTEYLPSPLTSVSFNPSHLTHLLTVASPHAVRIYDYATASLPSDDTSDGPFPTQGSWLLSLYPPFTRGPPMSTARKPIVAAEWIANGRAILTLLADGQWGIWDIDGASPSASGAGSGGLFSKATAGLRGSAITTFCVSGHLEGTSPLRNPGTQKAPSGPGFGGEFVPMTPHTRRDAIASTIAGGSERLAAVRGGITVTQLRTTQGAGPGEENAVLWLGGADPIVCVIPILSRFWDSQLRRAAGGGVNLWSGAQPTRMIRLSDLGTGLLGERCTGAAAIPKQHHNISATTNRSSASKENGTHPAEGLPIEVLLQGETRLVIVHESEDSGSLTTRLLGTRKKARTEPRASKAILAYPRPEKPNSVAFNLSIAHYPQRQGGGAFRPRSRPPVKGLFDQPMDVLPSTEMADEDEPVLSQESGLKFMSQLSLAADQPGDEAEAENRDIEQELMDVMEIDRELDYLETERQTGTKRVFFEEG